jgi:hypothetical protein
MIRIATPSFVGLAMTVQVIQIVDGTHTTGRKVFKKSVIARSPASRGKLRDEANPNNRQDAI